MRKSVWVLFLVLSLTLAACGPAMKPATSAETPSGEIFMLAFPRLVIDVDAQGALSVLGVSFADLGKQFNLGVGGFGVDPKLVQTMMAANVQHIEVRQTGDGIAMLANGMVLPHLAYDDASLDRATVLAGLFNRQIPDTLKKLLPAVRRLGFSIVLKFPLVSGVEEIALAEPEVAMAAPKPEVADPSLIVQFEIKYDEQGIPAILGVTAQDLLALGMGNVPVALHTDYIRQLQNNNIQNVQLRTRPDGLYLYVNGEPLPSLVWDNEMLANAAELYGQFDPSNPYLPLIQTLLPVVDNADIAILVHFPIAAGAEPIPAKMQ